MLFENGMPPRLVTCTNHWHKRCGFASSDGFALQCEWTIDEDLVACLYGKTTGSPQCRNTHPFPMPVFGPAVIVARNSQRVLVPMTLDIFAQLSLSNDDSDDDDNQEQEREEPTEEGEPEDDPEPEEREKSEEEEEGGGEKRDEPPFSPANQHTPKRTCVRPRNGAKGGEVVVDLDTAHLIDWSEVDSELSSESNTE